MNINEVDLITITVDLDSILPTSFENITITRSNQSNFVLCHDLLNLVNSTKII